MKMNDILRNYQKEAVEYICKHQRVILADEQGLGKTLVSLTALLRLMPEEPEILVFCPKTALGTWKKEARKWFDLDSMVYSGSLVKKKRQELWLEYKQQRPAVFIASYAMIPELLALKPRWKAIVCDEYHKAGLMNHKTRTYKNFVRLKSSFLLMLTGTPVKTGPQNLFAPLKLISSKDFSSYWRFVNTHCVIVENPFGIEIEPIPKNPSQFKKFLAPYLIRRTKNKVLKELPPMQRQGIYVEMTKQQKKCYEQIAETGMLETPDGLLLCANVATRLLRLRQLLCTPQSFGYSDAGGAIEALVDMVIDSFDAGRSVAICTPFKKCLTAIEAALSDICESIYKIHGDMKEMPSEISKQFQEDKKKKKAILFTITSGMSWDAYSANDIYFVGAEWAATDNAQAESRIHRLGQELPTTAYYILYPDTIDDALVEMLDRKTIAANWVLETDYMLQLLEKQRKKIKK